MQERRLRGMKRALREGVRVVRDEGRLPEYWDVLQRNLAERHGATPVHSLQEMELLRGRFPENIKLFFAELSGRMLAGVVVYESETTARTQYIGSTAEGRELGAIDLLLHELITAVFSGKSFVDLGTSMRRPGELDVGLIEQKEGFGARSVALDTWEWRLS
jgi:hypothetical protein